MCRLAISIILGILLCSTAFADTFTAKGRGKSEDGAVVAAVNNAVLLAVKQLLDEETIRDNKQTINSALEGKTAKLARLLKRSDAEFTGAGYEVEVVADVRMQALEQEINVLGLLQDAMGNPRIMVLYNRKLPQGSSLNSYHHDLEAFFYNSYGAIVGDLADKGFDVIDKSYAEQFSIQIADTHEIDIDTNQAAAYGLRNNADLVILYQTVGIGRTGYWRFDGGTARVFLRAQLINPNTSRIIASKDVESATTASSLPEALYRSAKDAGYKISHVMTDAIKKNWKREKSGAGVYIIVLDGVRDLDEMISFKNMLKSEPVVDRLVERETGGGKTTFEVRSGSSSDNIRNTVNQVGKQLGWDLRLVRSEGYRSTWLRR